MYKGVIEQIRAIKSGKDRDMTDEERAEFFWLAQAYNRVIPWHEYKWPVAFKEPPMHEYSLRDTYLSLIERREICKKENISLELIYEI